MAGDDFDDLAATVRVRPTLRVLAVWLAVPGTWRRTAAAVLTVVVLAALALFVLAKVFDPGGWAASGP